MMKSLDTDGGESSGLEIAPRSLLRAGLTLGILTPSVDQSLMESLVEGKQAIFDLLGRLDV